MATSTCKQNKNYSSKIEETINLCLTQKQIASELTQLVRSGATKTLEQVAQTFFGDNDAWLTASLDKTGVTVALLASKYGQTDVLRMCGLRDAGVLEFGNHDGKRPLHEAVQSSQLGCVEYLVAQGVTVDCLKRADWY